MSTLESLTALASAVNIDDDSLRVWTFRQLTRMTYKIMATVDDRITDHLVFATDYSNPVVIVKHATQLGMVPSIGETILIEQHDAKSAWIMTSVGIQPIAVRFAELVV